MKGRQNLVLALGILAISVPWTVAEEPATENQAMPAGDKVVSPAGRVLRSLDEQGEVARSYPPGREESPAGGGPESAGETAAADVWSVSNRDGEQTIHPDGSVSLSAAGSEPLLMPEAATPSAPVDGSDRLTIDLMVAGSYYYETYSASAGLILMGSARRYYLNDGTSWASGAGSYYRYGAPYDHAEVLGDTIRYHFALPPDGFLYRQTDYDAGDHSSNGTLGAASELVLEAPLGGTEGLMLGAAEIVANQPANYSEPRFNYWSAPLGSIVPFEVRISLDNGAVWAEDTFEAGFSYRNTAAVDFANPISTPAVTHLEIRGSGQAPENDELEYQAILHYENGIEEPVTGDAVWSVSPPEAATVQGGLLATGACGGLDLTLAATYTREETTVDATKTVSCRSVGGEAWSLYWETYQGDRSHSGHVPLTVEPSVFSVRWERSVGKQIPLNPVTAADGKVFASLYRGRTTDDVLFVLDARDGETLWSQGFASPNSVNPPAYAYGNVYIQTGNHGGDTYLWAFDANTGDLVFQAPHSAQWEWYWAPTPYDGEVYINGGYYGGMYAFDAFSGALRWFIGLPQYDRYTPAVDEGHVYAYLGEYSPGLYVVDRQSGDLAYRIDDPNFDWNGWSMQLAPVLGGMDDVIAIHDGRLIRFDLAQRSIAYEIQDKFSGQPSVAGEVVYAINDGHLEARDQASGALLRQWTPPEGRLTEHLILTDTHVLARTTGTTYAVEILSLEEDWSYPHAGHMALGEEVLYIAGSDGMLTAISIPEYTPAQLERIEVVGPEQVEEFSTAGYAALAYYDDGRIRDRTLLCQWTVTPGDWATMPDPGALAVGEMLEPRQEVEVSAHYAEGDAEAAASRDVELIISVSLEEFIRRNLAQSLEIKNRILADLEEAAARERAAAAVATMRVEQDDGDRLRLRDTLQQIRQVLVWGDVTWWHTARSAAQLDQVLQDLGQGGQASAP